MGFYPSGEDVHLAVRLLLPHSESLSAVPVAFFGRRNNIWTHIYTVYSFIDLTTVLGVLLWCNGRCYRFSQQLKERFNKRELDIGGGRNRTQEVNAQMHWILLIQVS